MRWNLYTSAEKMQVLWVCIGLPVLLLAAWLVRDWMDAGGSKKARKAAKALGSRTDEMEHARNCRRTHLRTLVIAENLRVTLLDSLREWL